jgi:hypothetical protein
MAKGYWVVFADVSDPEGYKEYIAANGPALAKYGARFLARGGKVEAKEGQPKSRYYSAGGGCLAPSRRQPPRNKLASYQRE